jgi:hypothetical protein
LPTAPSFQQTVVNGTEIVAFTRKEVYSFKLKLTVATASIC